MSTTTMKARMVARRTTTTSSSSRLPSAALGVAVSEAVPAENKCCFRHLGRYRLWRRHFCETSCSQRDAPEASMKPSSVSQSEPGRNLPRPALTASVDGKQAEANDDGGELANASDANHELVQGRRQDGNHCKQEEAVIVGAAVAAVVVCPARSSSGRTSSPPPTVLSANQQPPNQWRTGAKRRNAASDLASGPDVDAASGFKRSRRPTNFQWKASGHQCRPASQQQRQQRQETGQWRRRAGLLMLPLSLLVLLASLRFVESHVIYVKVGALFEESDHEQANMFIRTIKMINVRRDETIRQLLNLSSGRSSLLAVGAPNGVGGNLARQRQSGKMHHQWPAGWLLKMHLWQANNASGLSKGKEEAAAAQSEAAEMASDDVATSYTAEANSGGTADNEANSSEGSEGVIVKLEPMVEFLSDRASSLEADAKVCQLIESGVHALVGPTEGASIQHVQSICDNMDIPYFELRPLLGSTSPSGGSSLALVPPASSAAAGANNGGGGYSLLGAASASGRPIGFVANAEQPWMLAAGPSSPQPQPLQLPADQAEELDQHCNERPQSGQDIDNSDNFRGNGFSRQLRPGQASPVAMTMMPLGAATKLVATAAAAGAVSRQDSSEDKPRDFSPAESAGGDDKKRHKEYHFHLSTREQSMLADSAPEAELERQLQATSADSARANTEASSDSTNHLPTNRLVEGLTLNLYPPANLLTSAYIDLIYAWNWSSFAIVYEDVDSMIKFQDLLKESSGTWTSKWKIRLFQFNQSAADASAAPSGLLANGDKLNNLAAGQVKNFGPQRRGGQQHQQQFGQNMRPISNFRDIFWKIKQFGEQNILLDVRTENLYNALKHAQQVGCMTERFSYLVTSLDLHTIDLEDFKYSRTRITAFNLIQVVRSRHLQAPSPPPSAAESGTTPPTAMHKSGHDSLSSSSPLEPESSGGGGGLFDDKYLEKLGVHMIQGDGDESYAEPKWRQNSSGNKRQSSWSTASMSSLHRLFLFLIEQQEHSLSRVRLSTGSAILHDSLLLYTLGLNELDPSGSFLGKQQQTITCSLNSKPWLHGSSLVNYMRRISFTGLTGHVSFDPRGLRSEFKLDLMGVAPNIGLVKVGEWHSKYTGSLQSLRATGAAAATVPLDGGGGVNNIGTKSVKSTSSTGASRAFTPAIKASLNGPVADKNDKQQMEQLKPISDSSAELEKLPPSSKASDDKNNLSNIASTNSYKSPEEQSDKKQKINNNRLNDTAASGGSNGFHDESKKYESEFMRYKKLQADGVRVSVPYTSPISQSGALFVNEVIFEHLYKDQASQVDTLIITTKLSQPYFMLKETSNKLDGNEQYEGFAVDLVHELSKLVNFKFRWREVEDNAYGIKHQNGSWTGMIKEIIDYRADLAIVDLTITSQREEAVQFTLPFMSTGISILFKKPTAKQTTLFSFLSPFSPDVWAYVLAAYCGISTILFLVGHLSPYEWADPHPCRHNSPSINENESIENNDNNIGNRDGYDYDYDDHDSTTITNNNMMITTKTLPLPPTAVLKNQFSLLNSFWFTIGSLMQQGSDLTPRSMSTRTIAGIWYFFTLIMISSYTANLAAFLTVERVINDIQNVDDLSNQHEIKYGCVSSGTTRQFFNYSQFETHKRINQTMAREESYVASNRDGEKKVEEGKFAFFMESTSIEYIVERNCNLTQIGGLLDTKGYGIALNKKPRFKRPYRNLLSDGILHLQENGMLHALKNRWWKERRGGGTCTDDAKGGGVTELSLANVGGVFVVLLGGLGISFLVAIAEFIWRARRRGLTRDRMCDEMMSDLKFALACKSSTKPVPSNETGKMRKHQQQQKQQTKINGKLQQQQHNRLNHRTNQQSSALLSQLDTIAGEFDEPTTVKMATAIGAANQATFHQQHLQVKQHSSAGQLNNNQQQQRQNHCDPFLLQAMLSVLKRQQQHHQQHQQQYLADAVGQQPAIGGSDSHFALSNQQHELLPDEPTLSAAANDFNMQAANEHVPSWIPLSAAARFEADKRRLMFAQQTIDLTSTLPNTTIDSATTNIVNNNSNQNFVNGQMIEPDYDD